MRYLEIPYPHGFLLWRGKQTVIPNDKKLEPGEMIVISDGEAFGTGTLADPIQMSIKEFDTDNRYKQHRTYPEERRLLWPEANKLYVYRLENWEPFTEPKCFQNGEIIEVDSSDEQNQLIEQAKRLPKTIILDKDAVTFDGKQFSTSYKTTYINEAIKAVFERDIKKIDGNLPLSLYQLALVRTPNMKWLKKNKDVKQEGNNMPWKIEERDGQQCVVKVDDGEIEGCHDTLEEAQAQLAALHIAEDKSSKSWKDRFRQAAEFIKDLLIEPEKLVDMKLFDKPYGIAIKTIDGEPWHFTWSTNAFQDREGEIFTTKALENYVAESEKRENKGTFDFWHIPGTDFAKKEWQGVVGRFLVEAGPYFNNETGQAAKEFFEQYSESHPEIAPEGWGASPEFRFLPEERMNGIFNWLWIIRTSTLPKAAAANLFTEGKQIMLSEQQEKAAVEIFGQSFVDTLKAEGVKRTEELENEGVAHKGNNDTSDEGKGKGKDRDAITEDNGGGIDLDKLAEAAAKHFQTDMEPITEAIELLTEGVKALGERLETVEKTQALKEDSEMPRYFFSVKRASQAEESRLKENDELSSKKPKEAAHTNSVAASIFGDK